MGAIIRHLPDIIRVTGMATIRVYAELGIRPNRCHIRNRSDSGRSIHSELNDLEVSHHGHIFMFKVVTVKNVSPLIAVEPHDDFQRLGRSKINGVLPSMVVRAGAVAAGESLEMNEM